MYFGWHMRIRNFLRDVGIIIVCIVILVAIAYGRMHHSNPGGNSDVNEIHQICADHDAPAQNCGG